MQFVRDVPAICWESLQGGDLVSYDLRVRVSFLPQGGRKLSLTPRICKRFEGPKGWSILRSWGEFLVPEHKLRWKKTGSWIKSLESIAKKVRQCGQETG